MTSPGLNTKNDTSETSSLGGDRAETVQSFEERWHLDPVEAHNRGRACVSFRISIHDRMRSI